MSPHTHTCNRTRLRKIRSSLAVRSFYNRKTAMRCGCRRLFFTKWSRYLRRSKGALFPATRPGNQQVLTIVHSWNRCADNSASQGVLLDNAQELANAQRSEPTYEQLEQRFNLTVEDAVKHGLTSIHDAGFDPISLRFFRRSVVAHLTRQGRCLLIRSLNECSVADTPRRESFL